MQRTRLRPAWIATVWLLGTVATPSLVTAAPTDLFWFGAPNTISTGPMSGSSQRVIVTANDLTGGIAVDGVHNWIYWTYENYPNPGGGIRRANTDGTQVQTIYTDSDLRPVSIVVDPSGGSIYFGGSSLAGTNGAIKSANLDGSGSRVVRSGLDEPWGLALDSGRGRIYWTNLNAFLTNATIGACDIDGSSPQTVVSTGLSNPRGLAVDPMSQSLFWTDNHNHKIERSSTDGTNRITLLGSSTCDGIVFDPSTSSIIWADYGSPGSILMADSNGADVEAVFAGLGYPRNVTIQVPEPASISLLVLGAMGLLHRLRSSNA